MTPNTHFGTTYQHTFLNRMRTPNVRANYNNVHVRSFGSRASADPSRHIVDNDGSFTVQLAKTIKALRVDFGVDDDDNFASAAFPTHT